MAAHVPIERERDERQNKVGAGMSEESTGTIGRECPFQPINSSSKQAQPTQQQGLHTYTSVWCLGTLLVSCKFHRHLWWTTFIKNFNWPGYIFPVILYCYLEIRLEVMGFAQPTDIHNLLKSRNLQYVGKK